MSICSDGFYARSTCQNDGLCYQEQSNAPQQLNSNSDSAINFGISRTLRKRKGYHQMDENSSDKMFKESTSFIGSTSLHQTNADKSQGKCTIRPVNLGSLQEQSELERRQALSLEP